MDPVSITLGVLPLVGGAIKTSKILYKKLKIFRHYSREVRRIQKHLDRQAHFFINEIHLLLRHFIPHESHIEEMLKNGRDKRWDDKAFETSLQAALGDGYNACSEIIDEIGSAMRDLQAELQCFDELLYDSTGDESVKDTVRRLRNKVKIRWNQTKLEELVKDLRASNDDLRRLREQTFELSKSDHTAETAVQPPRRRLGQEYNQIALIRTASKALHAVLESAWSRTARPDRVLQHTVRLFLETEPKEETATQVLISCLSGHSLVREERRARLSIISQLRDWTESELLTPPNQWLTDEHRQKRRKVRFAEQETSPLFSQKLNRYDVSIRTTSTDPQNLSLTDLCSVLCKPSTQRSRSKAKAHPSSPGPCLGYLDNSEASDETLRHFLLRNAAFRRVRHIHASFHGGHPVIPPSRDLPIHGRPTQTSTQLGPGRAQISLHPLAEPVLYSLRHSPVARPGLLDPVPPHRARLYMYSTYHARMSVPIHVAPTNNTTRSHTHGWDRTYTSSSHAPTCNHKHPQRGRHPKRPADPRNPESNPLVTGHRPPANRPVALQVLQARIPFSNTNTNTTSGPVKTTEKLRDR